MTDRWLPHSYARLIFGRDHDIIGQSAWFPHRNCPPFQFTFASSHCTYSSCSHSSFEWNPGFPVFLFRRMVTICLSNQSNKSHRIWIYFLEILHQSTLKCWDRAGAKSITQYNTSCRLQECTVSQKKQVQVIHTEFNINSLEGNLILIKKEDAQDEKLIFCCCFSKHCIHKFELYFTV